MWILTAVYLQAGTKCTHGEAPACLGCRFSTLSAHLKGQGGEATHVWVLIEQAQQDQQQKKAELEHGFLDRESQKKKNPGVPNIGHYKQPLVCIYSTIFFLTFSFCSPPQHHFSLITFQIWPGRNKNSILTQVLQLMSLRTLKNKKCLSGPQFPHLIRRSHCTR